MKRIILIATIFLVVLASCDNLQASDVQKDYYFYVDGAKIEVGESVEDVLNKIGKYQALDTSQSCADEGVDEIYIYKGFRIIAHKDENSHVISSVEITSDMVSTPEGIKIESYEEDVIRVYGNGFERLGDRIIYTGANCKLSLVIRNNRVVSIKYAAK